jgi:hypothetical protein
MQNKDIKTVLCEFWNDYCVPNDIYLGPLKWFQYYEVIPKWCNNNKGCEIYKAIQDILTEMASNSKLTHEEYTNGATQLKRVTAYLNRFWILENKKKPIDELAEEIWNK